MRIDDVTMLLMMSLASLNFVEEPSEWLRALPRQALCCLGRSTLTWVESGCHAVADLHARQVENLPSLAALG